MTISRRRLLAGLPFLPLALSRDEAPMLSPDSPASTLADFDRRLRALEGVQRAATSDSQLAFEAFLQPSSFDVALYDLPAIVASGSRFLLAWSGTVTTFGDSSLHTSMGFASGVLVDGNLEQRLTIEGSIEYAQKPYEWVWSVQLDPGPHTFQWWWLADSFGAGPAVPTMTNSGLAVIPITQSA